MHKDRYPRVPFCLGTSDISRTNSCSLTGITIFRFAHMLRVGSSGGVEAYLNCLNRLLLNRNEMRIIQLFLDLEDKKPDISIEPYGEGELIWIPSFLKTHPKRGWIDRLWTRYMSPKGREPAVSHEFLLSALDRYRIDLAVFHWISQDSKIVLDYLKRRGIPFCVVNHFHNKRLNRRLIKSQISDAWAVGGVSNIDIPAFIADRYINLSDGVDTDYFRSEKIAPSKARMSDTPLLFLPSRITEKKGHVDSIRVLGRLKRMGVNANIAFAGRSEDVAFLEKLNRVIRKEGLQKHVIFDGEVSPKEMRKWYQASAIVILPSLTEGLGRILLEAQAMERPVVAYNVGGVSDAFLDGESGYLIKKGDVQDFTRRIRELLENPEKRQKMGRAGRLYVQNNFSLESLAERHENFYQDAINKRSCQSPTRNVR
jgi:glycosyltransferase involved in cell wall biosynthesis